MSKYYVQSGTMRSVVQAESSRKAALWAVHQAMRQVLPLEEENDRGRADARRSRCGHTEVSVLSAKLRVSEHGFDRADAKSLSTMEVVTQWNQMVTTLDRLQQMLHRAA
jgi:hypothetical protein